MSHHNTARRRRHRRLLAEAKGVLLRAYQANAEHTSRIEVVEFLRIRADSLSTPRPINDDLYAAAIRGIGMSTMMSQMAFGNMLHIGYLYELASALSYRR